MLVPYTMGDGIKAAYVIYTAAKISNNNNVGIPGCAPGVFVEVSFR